MKYPHIISRILTTHWAIIPAGFEGINRALNGASANMFEDIEPADDAADAEDDAMPAAPGVAIINVCGIIGKHLSAMESMCGGCGIEDIQADFMAAMADPSVTDVVICFDSPGGTVPGVPELAARMRKTAEGSGKVLYAFTDSLMASAAYWLASACDYIVCTPTATVGSIGVYCAYMDQSGALDKEGVKINLIKAGTYKDMGASHRPMTDEEQAMAQGEVDEIHTMFKAAVSEGRPDVKPDAMEGQTFMGMRAVQAGLVDEIAPDFEEFITQLQSARGRLTD